MRSSYNNCCWAEAHVSYGGAVIFIAVSTVQSTLVHRRNNVVWVPLCGSIESISNQLMEGGSDRLLLLRELLHSRSTTTDYLCYVVQSLRERRLNILVFCASIPVFSASDYKRHCWYSDTGACSQRCCSSAVRHCSICVNFEDIIVQCVACIVHTVKCHKSMGHMCCPSSLIAISFDRSIYAIASKISCTDFPLYKILHW